MTNRHLGSSFKDFLSEEEILDSAKEVATKRVLAWQITQHMERQGLSKAAMAKRMNTSRSSLDRLLDPENSAVTLSTLQKAAHAVGQRVELRLVDA